MFWYHDEVEHLEQKPVVPKGDKLRLMFYGSSSIRLWPHIEEDFPEFEVINQAFGGSTLAACCWFFERLVPKYKPDIIIFYAGDNDLGDGRHPEEVFFFFKILMAKVEEQCGKIPFGFISIKPSFAREWLINSIKYTNKILVEEIQKEHPYCTFINVFDEMYEINKQSRELFGEDGLHLTEAGYRLWKRIIREKFLAHFIPHQQIQQDAAK